jgi:2-dehydropantoate 2-reductase
VNYCRLKQAASGAGHEPFPYLSLQGIPLWYFAGSKASTPTCGSLRVQSVDPDGRQWNVLGPARAVGCTVYPATEVVAPGVINHIDGDRFGLGEPRRGETERIRRLTQAFEAGGLKPKIHPEIRNDIWLKGWGNLCFNPISALLRATLAVVATDSGTGLLAPA